MVEKLVVWLTEDLLSARTLFAAAFYGAAIWMTLHEKVIPPFLMGIIQLLLGHYFGSKQNGKANGPA